MDLPVAEGVFSAQGGTWPSAPPPLNTPLATGVTWPPQSQSDEEAALEIHRNAVLRSGGGGGVVRGLCYGYGTELN